jgi:hypothetical protein
MEINVLKKIFDNLFDNKIIVRHGSYLFCEFMEFTFEDAILIVKIKVLEPVVKLNIRNKNLYEKAKNKEYIECVYYFDKNQYIGLEKEQIRGLYCSNIWANCDFVQKIYKLKELGLEEEMYEAFWE